MGSIFKNVIKRILDQMGYSIGRVTAASDLELMLSQWLKSHHVEHVIDVGANRGQFAQRLRHRKFSGKIYSVEPLQDAHQELVRLAGYDENWVILPSVAIGATAGEAKFHVSQNSESSSLRNMLPEHLKSAPESKYLKEVQVSVRTLDSFFPDVLPVNTPFVLKIDTQGFEWEALQGIKSNFSEAKGVLLELSLRPLYEGQKLYGEFIDFFKKEGFELFYLSPNFADPITGQHLQVDAFFVRH